MNMNVLAPVSDLNAYISHVKSIPSLTLEQEQHYGKLVVELNDVESAQTLILHNLKHVVFVAHKYSGYGLPLDDLIQEGNIGLMKAVRNYDYTRGFKLITFAIHSITSEIQRYVMSNWSLVKLTSSKPIKKLFFNLRKLRQHTDALSCDEIDDIAIKLNVSPHHIRDMEQRLYSRDVSIDVDDDDDDDESGVYSLDKWIEDSYSDPALVFEREQQIEFNERALNAIEKLDGRTRDIIVSRYVTDKPATLHELAARYNISHERVRQLEVSGIKKLRVAINEV